MRTILETNLKIILDNRLQNKGTPFPAKAGCGVPLFKDLFYSPYHIDNLDDICIGKEEGQDQDCRRNHCN